jgi:hypothetical protein
MTNEELMVWITGHSAVRNTLWLLENRGCDAPMPRANLEHPRRLHCALSGGAAREVIRFQI